MTQTAPADLPVPRQTMEADIVCVGFGPAMGGFLTELARAMMNADGTPALESRVAPGMPLQALCYERADDIASGVSGVVTRGRALRASFPDLDASALPLTAPVSDEKVVYLLDPIGASRRSAGLRLIERLLRLTRGFGRLRHEAIELPFIPPFLRKHGGLVTSIGQLNSWVGQQLMGTGLVQIWPGSPVAAPLIEDGRVVGVRLADQGVTKTGAPDTGFMPGMDVRAQLTVVGDGPVGPVGRALDEHFGLPDGCVRRDWAVGMKMVVDLPEGCDLPAGTVIHTLGYPEPEIFGFMYVYPERAASLGVFVPSWFESPLRATYRYMQHWMQHPYLWRWLKGGRLRSWGAKSLQEAGRGGEPRLVGPGYARIGEGSGSTNVLTNSGVDEAWATGVMLAEAVVELWRRGEPFTQENLEQAYVRRRRESWLEREAQAARHTRNGFHRGFVRGLIGTALAGLTGGRLYWPGSPRRPSECVPTVEQYFAGRIGPDEIARIRRECHARGVALHDALMERAGWPAIPFDGRLLVSHQDALLLGGKVQAPGGFADHVVFVDPRRCERCGTLVCTEVCSGQAITPNPEGGAPLFDREKCVHCGACLWNCSEAREGDPERGNVEFRAGAGGLHSAEN